MTIKTKNLLLLAVVAVVGSGAIFTTIFFTADADDINKGIGQTEVWEPGPTDGFTPTEAPPRMNDITRDSDYTKTRDLGNMQINNKSELILSEKELDTKLESLRMAGLPIVSSGVDYDLGVIVIYTPDPTQIDRFQTQLADTPFVLLYEEAPPRWIHDGPEPEEKVGLQSSWLPAAYATGTSGTYTYYGTAVNTNTSGDGIYARMEVHASGVTIASGTGNHIYAPTISSAGKGALEPLIDYTPSTNPKLRIWDHSITPEGFIYNQSLDSTFMSRYSNTVGGSTFIYVQVIETSGTWYAYVYDLIDSQWDQMYSQANDGDQEYGWAIWEAHNMSTSDCSGSTIPEIIGADVQVRSSGSWSYATSSNSGIFGNPIDCKSGTMNNNYYDWKVN